MNTEKEAATAPSATSPAIRFDIVVTVNLASSKWIVDCLGSIAAQEYPKELVSVCVVDDSCNSEIKKFVEEECKINGWKAIFNETPKGVIFDLVQGFDLLGGTPDDICLHIEGKDWLYDTEVFKVIAKAYKDNPKVLFTYGQHISYPNNVVGPCYPCAKSVVDYAVYRLLPRSPIGQLRTFRRCLWKEIVFDDLINSETCEYYQHAWADVFSYLFMEMAAERHVCFNRILSIVNLEVSIDSAAKAAETAQIRAGAIHKRLRLPEEKAAIKAPSTSVLPRILLMADVRGWAFDINFADLVDYVNGFDFSRWYQAEDKPFPVASEYDLAYIALHHWSVVSSGIVPLEKSAGCIRSRWFGAPEEPPTCCNIDYIKALRGFHTVTQEVFDELKPLCPKVQYLTNPVNMRRIGPPTTIKNKVIASWNGNAQHRGINGVFVKGFWDIILPTCARVGMPLEFVEYNTKRLPPEGMPDFYRTANLSISASLYEGASNSCMEGMAAGHAFLTTDVGNAREMHDSQMKHFGESGIVFFERNEEDLAEKLNALKNDPERVVHMGELNRREISERWSWSAWAERYQNFFLEALK